jgi:hypothetical protein
LAPEIIKVKSKKEKKEKKAGEEESYRQKAAE